MGQLITIALASLGCVVVDHRIVWEHSYCLFKYLPNDLEIAFLGQVIEDYIKLLGSFLVFGLQEDLQ